jgi:pyridoxamine 5'-phosphate oxidase
MPHSAERTRDFAERTQMNVGHLTLEDLREEYRKAELNERNCLADPFAQFSQWFGEARDAHLPEPNAMTLATATPSGRPSARIVLLKEVSDREGFIFYSSYSSRKGKELEANPFCALVFYWAELERQVRVEGHIGKVPREKTERYFSGRPKGSRLGALVSNQSERLASRQPLVDKLLALEAKYAGTDEVPTPEYWGGYCVVPDTIEFWQGRPNRLHDRLVYSRSASGKWTLGRLSP